MNFDLIRLDPKKSGYGRSCLRLYEGHCSVESLVVGSRELDYIDYLRVVVYLRSLGHNIIGNDLLFVDCEEVIQSFREMSLAEMDLRSSPSEISVAIARYSSCFSRADRIKFYHCLGYRL